MATLLPFIVIIIAFWFLLIRPQQKRARQAREMQSSLAPGDRVMLTSGFFGEVTEIDDEGVSVDIADGVVVKVVRNAVGQVLPREDADEQSDVVEGEAGEGAEAGDVDLTKSAAPTEPAEPAEPAASDEPLEPTESGAKKPGSEESI